MSNVPDAWDDEWSTAADKAPTPLDQSEPRKISSKVSKAQRRAQQAEFNRQLWAEAEGPRETNYFLESRNAVPLRSEFKPPPVLLSRKGPPIVQSRRPPTDALNDLRLDKNAESSEDEDEIKAREKNLAERQAQAARDREEKQRKYEERRQELFGTPSTTNNANGRPTSRSGTSTPNSNTPPSSRSATPNRGRGRGRGRGGGGVTTGSQSHGRNSQRQQDLFDPTYSAKPESAYVSRRESPQSLPKLEQPVRTPKGPDGSGRGGFGFATRGGKRPTTMNAIMPLLESET
ncbi:uncharacterized protein HMPREF1541_08772 [Cyphellophora europaea CBS 101466]|uniref:SUZ-C domain-containing protein n=1 Tax=Cyphellophora europaea (strain CBS 101466) TaxID=1220924 RepID=W2RL92_CYPE1|nr:uncharacterized protein HMPREF1541_08772 [Cyphellophora europaea CBS 101466]ETN36494.1 hypothetical protein HMPREF1541_08772 [Cyphellophora europaea CBS 101466]